MGTDSGKEIAVRIESAYQGNRLSEGALRALNSSQLTDLDLGIPASEFDSDELLIATVMPDDSTSLNRIIKKASSAPFNSRFMLEGESGQRSLTRYEINYDVEPDDPKSSAEAIRIGHNAVVDALANSPRSERVIFATRYLNGRLLNPYGPIEKAQRLNRINFRPDRGTPLYDQTAELLKMVLAKYEQVRADWKEARTATLLVTDGCDEHSGIQTVLSIAEIIKSMRGTGHHIIAAMGIDDGTTDFRQIFQSMGIDPKWILTPGSTQKEIQEAFGMFAQTASKAAETDDFPLLLNSGFQGITEA